MKYVIDAAYGAQRAVAIFALSSRLKMPYACQLSACYRHCKVTKFCQDLFLKKLLQTGISQSDRTESPILLHQHDLETPSYVSIIILMGGGDRGAYRLECTREFQH